MDLDRLRQHVLTCATEAHLGRAPARIVDNLMLALGELTEAKLSGKDAEGAAARAEAAIAAWERSNPSGG